MSVLPLTRRRSLPGPKHLGTTTWVNSGAGAITSSMDLNGTQVTVSEGHDWPPSKKSREIMYDRGGAFYTRRSQVVSGKLRDYQLSLLPPDFAGRYYRYNGTLLPCVLGSVNTPWPISSESSDSHLASLGATAISRCAPTNSPADLSTAIGEILRDGLPHIAGALLWRAKAEIAMKLSRGSKHASDEYLNAQFGWKPLVNDVVKFCNALVAADVLLDQYERDAGRVVRRKYYFPSKGVNKTETSISQYIVGPSNLSSSPGKLVIAQEIERRQWFSGAFTYHLPAGYDSRLQVRRAASQAEHLLGLQITPEVLWNLAPWSWAAGWFVNVGDVISNLTAYATQGLVLRYGYVMEESVTRTTYTLSPTGLYNDFSWVKLAPLIVETRTKKRIKANPFGFGVSWEGLSPFQASIAAALGLSKGRR